MAAPFRARLSETCASFADLCFAADGAEIAEAFARPSLAVRIARLTRPRDDDLAAGLLGLAASVAMREVAALFDARVAELAEWNAFFDDDAAAGDAREAGSASRVASVTAASFAGTGARRAESARLGELRIDGADATPTIAIANARFADDDGSTGDLTEGEEDVRRARKHR